MCEIWLKISQEWLLGKIIVISIVWLEKGPIVVYDYWRNSASRAQCLQT